MAARRTRPDPALVRPRLVLAKEASTDYIHDVHEAMTTTTTLPTRCTVIAAPRQFQGPSAEKTKQPGRL